MAAAELRCRCEPGLFSFRSTAELPPLEGIIGQGRAVEAMEFGLRLRQRGYNIYVAGPVGTGRATYVRSAVQAKAAGQPCPDDWCYLYNFEQPDQPVAVRLPPGMGMRFQADMDDLLEDLRSVIPRAFESSEYEQQRAGLVREVQQRIEEVLHNLQEKARSRDFSIKHAPGGLVAVPLSPEGNPLGEEEFNQLPEEQRRQIEEQGRHVHTWIGEAIHQVRGLEKEAKSRLKELDRQVGLFAAGPLIDRLKEKYAGFAPIVRYLDDLKDDLSRHLDVFREEGGPAGSGAGGGTGHGDGAGDTSGEEEQGGEGVAPGIQDPVGGNLYFHRLKVNLFVNNAHTQGAPVIWETHPTYYNLFGKIEYLGQMGSVFTDFTLVRAGSVARANGGYLVLQAQDLLADPLAWEALKRTLKNGMLQVENIGEQYRLVPTATLKPQPIPVDLKVILIGSLRLYQLLYQLDEDFRKYFKIKVEFDSEMDATPEHLQKYAAFISAVCTHEGLRHFDPTGVGRVVEYGMFLAGSQDKLTTRFNELVDVIYEAGAWAESEGAPLVEARHVSRALREKIRRSNRVEEKIREMMERGLIYIDVSGAVVGQVNGLSVINLGDYTFGRPSRITAQTFLGEAGVVNIEREVNLSGALHDKGVMILSGFLGARYAQDKPLSLSASICFEQMYEGVDGDSASSAELYALLSSLAGLPIRQGLAVTGSVDQLGRIQAIGGVNHKIEGFFRVCQLKGFTGDQGVIIPADNARDLMLPEDVIQAVEAGQFHIYAVRTIDEGMELLTGVPAGERGRDGRFPEGTVNGRVDRRLEQLARQWQHFSGAGGLGGKAAGGEAAAAKGD
ncbi:MAG: AAA family ATPase [Firmicutes bacterium]|nr:AAA family ATPase [Bacillota bacterium]